MFTRFAGAATVLLAASCALGQAPPAPRQGLNAEQSRRATEIATREVERIRPNPAADPSTPAATVREYVVNVERLAEKSAAAGKAASPKAVVTTYRYADDTTIMTTVDLATGRAVDVSTAQHVRTPLSQEEFAEAQALARERVPDVRTIYDRFKGQVTVYPQFSQFAPPGEARVHRVVHLTYRVGKRDLSFPRPVVDLTTRAVDVPAVPGRDEPAPAKAAR